MRNLSDAERAELDRIWLQRAREISWFSGDPTTKVGCIVVGPNGVPRAEGVNDLPQGVKDLPERRERPAKYLWTVHAERKAVFSAARAGRSLEACTMYLPRFPCSGCAQAIIESGITEVVGIKPDVSDPKWGEDFEIAIAMFEEAGVRVRFVDEPAVERG